MRLTCPSCDAIYEVDEIAIPASGRRVRCSACDEAWRVSGEGAVIAPNRARPQVIADDEADTAAVDEGLPKAPEMTPEPPAEPLAEAATEQPGEDAPEAEPAPRTVETSPDTPAEAPPEAVEAAAPDADPNPPAPEAVAAAPEAEAEPAPAHVAAQEKPKPTYTPLRAKRVDPASAPQEAAPERGKRLSPMRSVAGFLIGFAAIMILASPYLFRAEIVAAAPGAAPVVDAYANVVGQAQSGIRTVVDAVAVEVNYLVSGLAAPEREAAAQAAGQ